MIKSRRMRWAGHVARMERRMFTKFLLESLKRSDRSEDIDVDGRIILKWTLRKQ
jgi:hypothetical protein